MTPAELAHVARVMRPSCVRWAASMVPHRVAEDVAQEALMALTRARGSVPLQAAHAWLREAVRRQALTALRGLRDTPGEMPEAVCTEPDPEVTLISAQLAVHVREAMDRIAESRRTIVAEVMGHERPLADVAREQGIPESTAQSRLHAGARELRDDLQRQRASERRRTRGSTSWMFAPFMDVRAALKRLALLGATAMGGLLLYLPSERLAPTPEEPIVRAAQVEVRQAVNEARAVPGVQRAEAVQARPRARHDAPARMLAERMRRPE